MKIFKRRDYVMVPDDPAMVERRLQELEKACREAMKKLTPEERADFEEYYTLLRQRETKYMQLSFQSGVRVGERRGK